MQFPGVTVEAMGYMPVYGTLQCTQVNNAEIKLSAFLSWLGMLWTWQLVQDMGHDSNDFHVIMLQIIKCSYRARTHRQPPYAVAVSPSKDLINFTSFPSFVFILNFQIWLWLSCSARASGCRPSPPPHSPLLKRSRLLPAGRHRAFIQQSGAPSAR